MQKLSSRCMRERVKALNSHANFEEAVIYQKPLATVNEPVYYATKVDLEMRRGKDCGAIYVR